MHFVRKIAAIAAIMMFAALPVFAAQTALTPVQIRQNNYSVVAGDLAITFTACDAVNGNSFYSTGQEILFVQNSDSGAAHTFTVQSVTDAAGRVDTSLTGYSVAASAFATIQIKNWSNGWWQPGGQNIYLACNSNQIKFAVVRYQ